MKYSIALIILLLIACNPSSQQSENAEPTLEAPVNLDLSEEGAKKSINKVLSVQQDAWNDGDIDAFMEGYWNSDELIFIGRSGVNKGWQTTLDNYKKGYPDKAAMGQLSFEVIQLDQLSQKVYRMIGRYTLKREKDEPTGIFTLIWKYIDGRWLIVSDQTCG